jgi:hypothetical protein
MTAVPLRKSGDGIHKWTVQVDGHTVHFGRKGYSDYTIHKDRARMLRYLGRHIKRENWTKAGRATAGFWSRWLLWSEPNLRQAIKRTEKVLGSKYKIKLLTRNK